ncbi:hypothetical protein BJ508DRAFT_343701 [Ascobolus immersus RN42]|uniref:Uncharacterized protein n=1 Tax=Ascobolus immersus RN42 TaxID=1160509 RepID=A0A3N4IA13_ASCIM|nr:hypothetical protein BJ508DRAFT_343701 [Ascobolus immersus RN42]
MGDKITWSTAMHDIIFSEEHYRIGMEAALQRYPRDFICLICFSPKKLELDHRYVEQPVNAEHGFKEGPEPKIEMQRLFTCSDCATQFTAKQLTVCYYSSDRILNRHGNARGPATVVEVLRKEYRKQQSSLPHMPAAVSKEGCSIRGCPGSALGQDGEPAAQASETDKDIRTLLASLQSAIETVDVKLSNVVSFAAKERIAALEAEVRSLKAQLTNQEKGYTEKIKQLEMKALELQFPLDEGDYESCIDSDVGDRITRLLNE